MKKHTIIIPWILFCTILFLVSCEEKVETPVACLTAPETVKINEPVLFEACSEADYYVVWPGDTLHNYYLRDSIYFDRRERQVFQNGFAMIGGRFQYIYRNSGTYKVVLVATNSAHNTDDFRSATTELTIVVEE
jgi:hypothetical protein